MTPFVEYFRTCGEISDPGGHKSALLALPDDPAEICGVIQGLVIHPFWIDRCGARVDPSRANAELQARGVADILDHIYRLDDAPLDRPRDPQKRVIGTCRHASLLLCSVLRTKGLPARLRCGFATYLEGYPFGDRWICEYWSETEKYWVRVDPQLGPLQLETLDIDFDPGDIPIDDYLYAGEGWIMCRRERSDPADFGVGGSSGLGFIKGSIVRDMLALNKIETLPWDRGWGILDQGNTGDVERGEFGYIDRLARCSANSLVHLAHSFFNDDDKIRFPQGWSLEMSPTLAQLNDESYRM